MWPRARPVTDVPARGARRAGVVASALVAAGLFWWFLRGVDLDTMAAEIRHADTTDVVAAVAVSLAGFGVRALRWRHLVAPFKWVSLRSLTSAVFIGSTVTALLPGRLGEVARAVSLGRREGLPSSTVFGTIVLERLIDVLALVILVAASLALVPPAALGSEHASLMLGIRSGAWLVFGALVGVAAVMLAAHRVPDSLRALARRWIGRMPGRLYRFGWTVGTSFANGLSLPLKTAAPGLAARGLRAAIAGHTLLLWATICAVHALLFRAFDIDASVAQIPPLLFLITLGLSVPVPASLGSYHKAVQVGLTTMMGVSNETAAGYAIVSHVVTQGPPVLIGVVLLARQGLRPSTFVSSSASTRAPAE
jgi:uncharacterized membrane protein YbhN (UPF0104 family)